MSRNDDDNTAELCEVTQSVFYGAHGLLPFWLTFESLEDRLQSRMAWGEAFYIDAARWLVTAGKSVAAHSKQEWS